MKKGFVGGNIDACLYMKIKGCSVHSFVYTKKLGLYCEPFTDATKPWEIVCFSDTDYAGDQISRRRISGFILYVFLVIKNAEKCDAIEFRS